MKKILFLILFCFLPIARNEAVETFSIYSGRSGGEYIFETGSKYPNFSGIKGGSRITYNRDFYNIGLAGSVSRGKWNLKGEYTTTPGYVSSGGGRDEDFYLYSISSEKGTKLATRELSWDDSAHVFTGTRNFSDAKTTSELKEFQIATGLDYYMSGNANPWQAGNFFYVGVGARYGNSKYILENVKQFVTSDPPVFFALGRGLTYSLVSLELPVGIGGGTRTADGWTFYTSFEIMYAASWSRDFHILRALNFFTAADGSGLRWVVGTGKTVGTLFYSMQLTEHRLYLVGNVHTSGGLNENDITSNYLGTFQAYLNTKDYEIRFSVTGKL